MGLLDHIACITGEKVMVKLALCLITCDITKVISRSGKTALYICEYSSQWKQVTASCTVCFIPEGRSPELPWYTMEKGEMSASASN